MDILKEICILFYDAKYINGGRLFEKCIKIILKNNPHLIVNGVKYYDTNDINDIEELKTKNIYVKMKGNQSIGIDGIMELYNNKFAHVQIKFSNNKKNKPDLTEFLKKYTNEKDDRFIKAGIFICNYYYKPVDNLYVIDKLTIEKWFIDNEILLKESINNEDNNKLKHINDYNYEIKLDEIQQMMYEQFINDINNKNELAIFYPTGYGKTYMSRKIIKNYIDTYKLIVLVFPKKSLLEDNINEFIKYVKNYEILAVCSSIVDYYNTTNLKEIEIFINNNQNNKCKIIVTTYISVNLLKLVNNYNPDMIVFDEAHVLNSDVFDYYNNVMKNTKKIYLTATPLNLLLNNVKNYYTKTILEGIKEKRLSDFNIYMATLENYKDLIDSDLYEEKEINDKCKALFINDLFKNNTNMKCMAFANKHESINIYRRLIDNNLCKVLYDKPKDGYHRKKILEKFRKCKSNVILLSVKVFLMGTDVPDCDTVIFLEPTQSDVDIRQKIGRCLRKKDDKKANIIIPLLTFDNDLYNIYNDKYSKIIEVLKYICSGNDFNVNNVKEEDINLLIEKVSLLNLNDNKDYTNDNLIIRETLKPLLIKQELNIYNIHKKLLYKNNIYSKRLYHIFRLNNKLLQLPENPETYYYNFKGWDDYLTIEKMEENELYHKLSNWWNDNKNKYDSLRLDIINFDYDYINDIYTDAQEELKLPIYINDINNIIYTFCTI